MTDSTPTPRRRRVLGVAAAGAATLLGATGAASAGHLLPGDCARLTIDVQAFTEACPNGDPGPTIPAGTEGTVWATCTTGGTTMVRLRHTGDRTDRHWVSEQYLERC